ncbi:MULTISPECIES: FG-GAP-like repeat-containing protein [Streptomyces]|uniref:Fusidic acid esterase FusH n=1 Tax=Streptomyces luteosporeus TaxID=173856 RepID=A0ABN3U194_9ACTN
MTSRRPRTAWATGLLATAAAAGLLTAPSAHAVAGDPVKDSFAFSAKLDIAATPTTASRSCSAALVANQWLITAASCFADSPNAGFAIPAGKPAAPTTATIGRADLTRETGAVVDVVELVPRADRDLVLAKLAKPVTGIAPVAVTTNAPLAGEELRVTGYGRTKDEWVPDRLHTATFSVGTLNGTTVGLAGKSAGAAVCQGDTGGPAFREVGGRAELVAVNSRSWRGGCFGTDEKETRTGALDTRVDDLAGWVREVTTPPEPKPRPSAPLGDYQVDFDGDGKADYVVVDDNGAVRVWLNQGGDTGKGWKGLGQVASGVGVPGTKVRFADIDGDGKADYLAVDDNGAVRAWLNRGGDTGNGWSTYGQLASGAGAGSKVRFADLNGDRKADYLIVEDNGAVKAWLNNGGDPAGSNGWKSLGQIAGGTGAGSKVRFADIDGDGKADYLVVEDDGAVKAWLFNGGDTAGSNGWKTAGQIAGGVGSAGSKVRFSDINGDRKADYLAVDDNGAIQAWLNNGGDTGNGWIKVGLFAGGVGSPGSNIHI